MIIELIPQTIPAGTIRRRVGDVLAAALNDFDFDRFHFAVAYMRLSGYSRLSDQLENFMTRGGSVFGAVGIDDGITTVEALRALAQVSTRSTVFHTISGFIYHPKLYLFSGPRKALAVIGSANFTRDGLYRNIEVATAIHIDRRNAADTELLRNLHGFIDLFLDIGHPNVKLISNTNIDELQRLGLIKMEADSYEPGPSAGRRRQAQGPASTTFPPISVPVAPPPRGTNPPPGRALRRRPGSSGSRPPIRPLPARAASSATIFIMELSAFDCSHRTGVPGTPEILIPHGAIPFFPPITMTGRKYPDTVFDIALNTPTGQDRHSYRLWYYETRATGTRIDEYRLRMDKATIDLTTIGGGDLLVVTKQPNGSDLAYEATIIQHNQAEYTPFRGMCTQSTNEKRWGLA